MEAVPLVAGINRGGEMMMDKLTLENFLTDEEIVDVNNAITTAEKTTAGEIKVLVVGKSSCLNISLRKAREMIVWRRAKKEFFRLGLDKTQDHTGILLMISLKERIAIVKGGASIEKIMSHDVWSSVCDKVLMGITFGTRASGLIQVVEEMGEILTEHFPVKSGDVNEISDEIEFLQ